MKYLLALVAIAITFTASSCAHKDPKACGDSKCCKAK